jgi:hypothetical protein
MNSSPFFPHDAGRDGHWLVEGVLGLAGSEAVEDALPGRPGVGLLALEVGRLKIRHRQR